MLTLTCFEFLRIEFSVNVRRLWLPVWSIISSCTLPKGFFGHSLREDIANYWLNFKF